MTLRVLYFDDEPGPRDRLARELSSDVLVVESQSPPPNLAFDAIGTDWDGFLIDFELTKPTPEGTARYRGGTLAFALRERMGDVPLILITRQNLNSFPESSDLLTELPVFDDIVYKSVADERPDRVRRRIVTAAEGFAVLRQADKSWTGLVEVLRPPHAEDTRMLRRVHPPIAAGHWRVVSTARWLERVLLAYPGALLNSLHAASFLGVDDSEIAQSPLADVLRPGEFQGPLTPEGTTWWKGWLVDYVVKTMALAGISRPPYLGFRDAFLKLHGHELSPSKCVDCHEPADAACYVLKRPVKTEHSVLYYPDNRPAAMIPARVSLLAIRDSNDVDEDLIDPATLDLIRKTNE
jgi:hypothetical protein